MGEFRQNSIFFQKYKKTDANSAKKIRRTNRNQKKIEFKHPLNLKVGGATFLIFLNHFSSFFGVKTNQKNQIFPTT